MSTPNVKNQKEKLRHLVSRTKIRTAFIAFMLLIEVAAIITIIILSQVYNVTWVAVIYWVAEVISIIVAIRVINSHMDPAYKITWLAFMVINSIMGAAFYLLFANKKFSKREKNFNAPILAALNNAMNSSEANGLAPKSHTNKEGKVSRNDNDKEARKRLANLDPDLVNFIMYIRKYSFTDTYKNTRTTYYPWGENAFPVMLEKLKQAKHYIFMEYFIIDPGKFWDSILEVLLEKAKQGLDVRVMYDDLGCLSTLPAGYDQFLRDNGIKCYRYAPIKPFVDIRMNNRDHRKIMVIDGHTGFTGGINIADEYINEIVRFGKWKDNAIMLEGDGVFGLTNLFLSVWARVANDTSTIDFKQYLPARYASEVPYKEGSGYVSVYGSIPYTYETVGLNIYTMLCYKATKTLDICTPYLILNKEMENAIMQAAKNGVRVRLLTPRIPDKKMVFEITRSYYDRLLKCGVEIYEYVPGFVHAKMFLVDGKMATVGTINLDYRSLFLHSENGCFLYEADCIKDIQDDFDKTFEVSEKIDYEQYKKTSRKVRILRGILRVFAPLM